MGTPRDLSCSSIWSLSETELNSTLLVNPFQLSLLSIVTLKSSGEQTRLRVEEPSARAEAGMEFVEKSYCMTTDFLWCIVTLFVMVQSKELLKV